MDSDQLPSWGPEADRARVKAARGAVREALGGLRNVEQLLGSLRVGPRALANVIPDVVAALVPVPEAFSKLAHLIRSQLPETGEALQALTADSLPAFASLSAGLHAAGGRPMNARNRLLLHSLVSQHASILASASDLLDLLGNVAWSRRDTISLRQVLHDTFRDTKPVGQMVEVAEVAVSSSLRELEVVSNPSALASVVAHAVRWLLLLEPRCTPHVFTTGPDLCALRLVIDTDAALPNETRWLGGRQTLPCVAACLKAVAPPLAFELDLDASARRAILSFTTPSILAPGE